MIIRYLDPWGSMLPGVAETYSGFRIAILFFNTFLGDPFLEGTSIKLTLILFSPVTSRPSHSAIN